MKCLILGGGGFIGTHLCKQLIEKEHEVRIFERPNPKIKENLKYINQIEWIEGDFANPVDLTKAIKGCEIIFHLICTTIPKSSNDDPLYDINSNLLSTIGMLNIAKQEKVKKVIFVSSGGTVYGIPQQTPITENHPTNPICSYGITKLAIEKYLHLYYHLHQLDYCVLRVSNPYGEGQNPSRGQGVIAAFLSNIAQEKPIEIWGDGSVVRDYIYVGDVALALEKAIAYNGKEKVFNIGSGEGISLNELIKIMSDISDKEIKVTKKQARPLDVPVNILDITKAKKYLNWKPSAGIKDGLKNLISQNN